MKRLLRTMLLADRLLTVDEIQRRHTDLDFDTIDQTLVKLASHGVVYERPDQRFRFVDPIIRSFCFEAIGGNDQI